MTASDRAAAAQPLWALVAPRDRARYLRRAAMAVLDELDALADLLAAEAGQPRSEAMLAELLPSVGGLHGLAGDGPAALADRRLGPVPGAARGTPLDARPGAARRRRDPRPRRLALGAARCSRSRRRCWPATPSCSCPPRRAPPRGCRTRSSRAGLPEELFQLVAEERARRRRAHRSRSTRPPAKGTMLVLEGAPLDRAVTGARLGRVRGRRPPPRRARARDRRAPAGARARRRDRGRGAQAAGRRPEPARHRGRPARRASTERDRVEALVAQAEAAGATRLCGGPVDVPGVAGAFYAPVVLRAVPPGAALLHEPVPGPVLALLEAATEEEAIALAGDADGTLSVWTGDRARGERIARDLGAEIAWINEHGVASPAAPVGSPSTSRRASSPRSRRGCAPRAGCPTTRRCCAPRPPPRGCCTGASPSAGPRCAAARCRSPAPPCG